MIFSVAILLLVLVVTYVHYLQGAFTSAISMACALAATLVAFGYYENVINTMSQSGLAAYAGGLSLIIVYAITYLILRVAADALVPGNIALQLYVERIGAVVFGGIAALLGVGTLATGVQLMPFGATVAGFSPYELRERSVNVPAALIGRIRASDAFVFDEVVSETMSTPPSGLILPADALVLSLVKMTSDGAFSGAQSFSAVHPDLPVEAFRARLGGEHSHKFVIFNNSKAQNATLDGLYTVTGTPAFFDTEVIDIRPNKQHIVLKPSSNDRLVVARVTFADAAAEKDGIVRLTPAAARLVIGDAASGVQTYFPVGSMEGASHVGVNRIDDVIPVPIISGARSVDLVYVLPKAAADALAKPATEDGAVRFLELKLFGRIDLSDKKTDPFPGASKAVKVIRKRTSPIGVATKGAATPAGG